MLAWLATMVKLKQTAVVSDAFVKVLTYTREPSISYQVFQTRYRRSVRVITGASELRSSSRCVLNRSRTFEVFVRLELWSEAYMWVSHQNAITLAARYLVFANAESMS